MTLFLRRMFATVLVLGVVAPATASICLQADARHCTTARSAHECCEGPRLSSCHCQSSHGGAVPSEPASQSAASAAPSLVAVLAVQPGLVLPADRVTVHLDSSPPPFAGGDRLSLFSILLV